MKLAMNRNPVPDFILFLVGAALACGGGFLFANQVMASSGFGYRSYGGWGSIFPMGTPGMGLLLIPLGLGVAMLITGANRRWAMLMLWGSLGAIAVGVLNSIRLIFLSTTLWTLGSYIVMIAVGGGLMLRSLSAYGDN